MIVSKTQTQVIDNDCGMQLVEFFPPVVAICEIGRQPFTGIAHIAYQPDDKLIEFISMEDFIRQQSKTETTIEKLTRTLFDELVRVLGDIPVMVHIYAETAVHAPASALIKQGEFKYETQNHLDYRNLNRPVHWRSSSR